MVAVSRNVFHAALTWDGLRHVAPVDLGVYDRLLVGGAR